MSEIARGGVSLFVFCWEHTLFPSILVLIKLSDNMQHSEQPVNTTEQKLWSKTAGMHS